MIALLSPAKKLDESPLERDLPTTTSALEEDTHLLLQTARGLSKSEIQALMNLSERLADLTHARFQTMTFPFTEKSAKPAALLFAGDTYQGFDAPSLSKQDLTWAQDHVRILSGLFGVLRPLDRIQPYRLEMGTRLATERGKNLYDFWGTRITETLNRTLDDHVDRTIIRLASKEYFSAIQPRKLDGRVVHCVFKEMRDGKLKQIGFYAKKARGMMARFLVQHRIERPEDLQAFCEDRYLFQSHLSSDTEFVFTRPDSRR